MASYVKVAKASDLRPGQGKMITAGDNPERLKFEAAFAAPLRSKSDTRFFRQDEPAPAQPWW